MRMLCAVAVAVALSGCGKKGAKSSDTGGGGGGGVAAGVGVAVNPGGLLGGGGGGGGGAAQAVRKAVRRTQSLNELKNLAETIESMRDPIGKMPTKAAVLAEAQKSLPKVYEGLMEGAYVLADPMQPGGLWAYEVDADTKPGIAVIAGRAARSQPDDLQQYFAAMPKSAPPPPPQQPMAVQPAAAVPTVTKDDLQAIFTFVDAASGSTGKMPTGQQVYDALVANSPSVATLVQKKAIILLQPAQRESVWAAEAKAYTQGGMIVTNTGVETVTAAELQRRTGK